MYYTGFGIGTASTFRSGYTMTGITTLNSAKTSISQQSQSANL